MPWHSVCYIDRKRNCNPLAKETWPMMTLTENAVAKFIEGAERPVSGLRVMVKGGGCSGMQYSLQLKAPTRL